MDKIINTQIIPLSQIVGNRGQLKGLPKNPAMDRYTAKTPSGRDVSGRLEVEDDIRYIVQTGDDDDETWYMVHTSTVRKEEANG